MLQSFQKVAAGSTVRLTFRPASRICAAIASAVRLLPFDIDRDELEFVVGLAGLGEQLLRLVDVALGRADIGIFGVHRADMVVVGRLAATVEAELQHGGIVDRELGGAAHLDVVIGRVADIEAGDDGRAGGDLGIRQPHLLGLRHAYRRRFRGRCRSRRIRRPTAWRWGRSRSRSS